MTPDWFDDHLCRPPPPSRLHQVAFFDMHAQGEGVYHYSDLPDFSSEAEYTFAPFRSTSLLQKLYVAVKSLFDLCSVKVRCTWASQDAQMGFVQVTERWTMS